MKTNILKINIFILFLLVSFGVFTTKTIANSIPEVNTSNVTVNTFDATAYGMVKPNGQTTTAWFEYSTDLNFTTYMESTHFFVGSQNTNSPIKITIRNLKPDNIYYGRMVADNSKVKVEGNILMFKTNPRIENQTVTIVNTQTINTNNSTPVRIINNTNSNTNTRTEIITRTVDVVVDPNLVIHNSNMVNTPVFSSINNNNNFNNNNLNWVYPDSNQNNLIAGTAYVSSEYRVPQNLFEWLILLLIIVAIIGVFRRIFY